QRDRGVTERRPDPAERHVERLLARARQRDPDQVRVVDPPWRLEQRHDRHLLLRRQGRDRGLGRRDRRRDLDLDVRRVAHLWIAAAGQQRVELELAVERVEQRRIGRREPQRLERDLELGGDVDGRQLAVQLHRLAVLLERGLLLALELLEV